MRYSFWILFLMVLLSPIFVSADLDPDMLAGMKARSIGPASMSGRVAAIDAVVSNPDIIYVGAATGGVWKSVNGGISWIPVFDDQPVAAAGAVAIFQPNPDIVWVGTGEGNPRNSASVGNGVYKSLDGGRKWVHVGLEATERIHRIVLHPTNPEIAYVAAMGREWGENAERGVFKTTDGGKTWKKVLYVNEKVGAADLIMDPSNPNKLFAAMWEYRRWPWFFKSGGPGSGLYWSFDGGESWEKITEEDGLPKGPYGRIGLAISHSNPQIVYALVEGPESALVRSEDGGKTWKIQNQESTVANRPFYYADIRVDPALPNRVYNLASLLSVSDDGGKTFEVLVPFHSLHPDYHALWIHPKDATFLIAGNDGGIAISHDRGATWRFVSNLPLAQFYHIRVDNNHPYDIFGGLQDNGSWRGPSQVWENGGIRNHHWQEVGFGDGFDVVPDPRDSLRGYAMSQEGYLVRWDLHTGERKDIRPAHPEGIPLRFNWNAAIAIDPENPDTIYYGSQFVHKSTDRGDTWTIISPDLTTNNPEWQKQEKSGGLTPDVTGAENFTTIITIAPSPLDRNVIWVGTDDGRLHVTRDGGKTWTSLEKNVKGVPENTWIPHITPSKHDVRSAFVLFDDHRRSNWTPYVYVTDDFGVSWKNIATSDISGYALVLEQDPVKKDLLFLGTEFGLYFTLNGGKKWYKFKHGFPTVSVMDMVIHPREHDLVIGTHGRAVYIIDDIRPFRTLSEEILKKPIHLFEVPDAQQYRVKQTSGSRFPGQADFCGENRPYGALLTYSLNISGLPHPDEEKEKEAKEAERQKKAGEKAKELTEFQEEDIPPEETLTRPKEKEKGPQVTIEITDESGTVIRTFKAPARMGVNRATWDLRRDAFREPPVPEEQRWREPSGPEVLPGTYGIKIKYQEHEATGKVRVLADPRYQLSAEVRKAKWDAQMHAGQLKEKATIMIERLQGYQADINVVFQKIEALKRAAGIKDEENNPYKDLQEKGGKLKKELKDWERKWWIPPKTKGIVAEKDVFSKIQNVEFALASSWDRPTEAQLIYMRQAEEMLQKLETETEQFLNSRILEFQEQVEAAGILLFAKKGAASVNSSRESDFLSDPHSFGNSKEVQLKHLSLNLSVDFQKKVLSGSAAWQIESKGAKRVVFDTRGLTIEKVTTGLEGTPVRFEMGKRNDFLGVPLTVEITPETKLVTIYYRTDPDAGALQWLNPSQTAGGKHPFLFTQSQPILARTWVPCHDSPGVRFTYDATIRVPEPLMAVMSAENPTEKNRQGVYHFKMNLAVPAYLLALAVGDLEFRSTGKRTGVYAEPAVVEKAAWEFAETEKMIQAAEKLYGPYRWGRYDLIVLPPSFPYGGMENPRLTFATPTVLAGDRSLVSLVAHELAHSWSGNLVTNATWDDFWLNEGFTVYFENRIMEEVYGKEFAEMIGLIGYQELLREMKEMKSEDTHLKMNLKGRDPDEGFTQVPYEKGFLFLRTIEKTVGRQRWDAYLRSYFDRHAFQSVSTEDFLADLRKSLLNEISGVEEKLQIQAWVYGPGLPSNAALPQSDRFLKVEQQVEFWIKGQPAGQLETKGWTTQEWMHFIRKTPEKMTHQQMKELDETFGFSKSGNSEILHEWLLKVVTNHYEAAYPALERFLTGMGRRKFLRPLYTELAKTPEGLALAKKIYSKARPTYHPVSVHTVDQILKWQDKGEAFR